MSRLTRGPPFSGAAVDFMGRRMATLLGWLMRWAKKTTRPSARRKAGERSRYGLSTEGRGKSIGALPLSSAPARVRPQWPGRRRPSPSPGAVYAVLTLLAEAERPSDWPRSRLLLTLPRLKGSDCSYFRSEAWSRRPKAKSSPRSPARPSHAKRASATLRSGRRVAVAGEGLRGRHRQRPGRRLRLRRRGAAGRLQSIVRRNLSPGPRAASARRASGANRGTARRRRIAAVWRRRRSFVAGVDQSRRPGQWVHSRPRRWPNRARTLSGDGRRRVGLHSPGAHRDKGRSRRRVASFIAGLDRRGARQSLGQGRRQPLRHRQQGDGGANRRRSNRRSDRPVRLRTLPARQGSRILRRRATDRSVRETDDRQGGSRGARRPDLDPDHQGPAAQRRRRNRRLDRRFP